MPELHPARLELFFNSSEAPAQQVSSLWGACAEQMYTLTPRQRQLGLGKAKGISTYFSANCEEEDAEVACRFLSSLRLSPYNTRLFKRETGYVVLLASAEVGGGDDQVPVLARIYISRCS